MNVNENALPWVAVAAAALVIDGACETVSVNVCEVEPRVLVAVIVIR